MKRGSTWPAITSTEKRRGEAKEGKIMKEETRNLNRAVNYAMQMLPTPAPYG